MKPDWEKFLKLKKCERVVVTKPSGNSHHCQECDNGYNWYTDHRFQFVNCLNHFKKSHSKLLRELEDQVNANTQENGLKRFQLMNKTAELGIVKPAPASILSLLFKELQKPETTTWLGEWNQFLSVQVEEIPDLVFWRRYCDQFPSIFHVWLQCRSSRPSSAQLEGMFSTLTKIVPQDRESTSQDCLLRVKTTLLTHPELNAFLETHVTEVGRPKGDSKINLEIKD